MRNFKAKISKLEKNIKPRKKLYKIHWADGTFVGEYWALSYWGIKWGIQFNPDLSKRCYYLLI